MYRGQVENQVGLVLERFFTPRLRFKSYEELNAWLLDECVAYAKAHRHVDQPERTIWEAVDKIIKSQQFGLGHKFDGTFWLHGHQAEWIWTARNAIPARPKRKGY